MKPEQARRLIQDTFEHTYEEAQFRQFARNLLKNWQEDNRPPLSGAQVSEAFRHTVSLVKKLGGFQDAERLEVDVLTVKLKSGLTLERARTAQRNFVARYLEAAGRTAALVAFYSDDRKDWRFSLIKLEVDMVVSDAGKMKLQKTLTPAKRFSFLVGEGEGSHTAQRRLVDVLEGDVPPTLSELEAAFNIEVVTDEFFEQYKELFLKLREDLDLLVKSDTRVAAEFKQKSIDTSTFAKRLMGQLVFLYFVQKKGWLGVGMDQQWGEGPKDYLQRLYRKEVVPYNNFFDDVLEPLFYQALAADRRHDGHFFSHFRCRIPFLNGGLFEPIHGYDWVNTPITLPNEHLGEVLATFDLYNFTVQEDSPLDKEVAVDPEMLGKVFENLLEVNNRKSKGAFYTPREIVHFMAQDALIHYLDSNINIELRELAPAAQHELFPTSRQPGLTSPVYVEKVSVSDLSDFVRYADLALENDATTAAKGQETEAYSFKLPATVREHAQQLDALLAKVKVIDPAIGSGAFPMGILTEIVRTRLALTPFLMGATATERTAYALKRHAIHESIYGVDIDAAALDVAKLRLWLSLVVDEHDFTTIKPLPNLDYKVVSGNTMGRIEGFRDFDAEGRVAALKDTFFDENNPTRKAEMRGQIDAAIQQVYAEASQWGQEDTFDFHVAFGEVFKEGGFDIAIGNPPYVRQEAIKNMKPALKKAFPEVFNGTADLYVYFYAAALRVLKQGGVLAYITPNKWFKSGYGKTLRKYMADTVSIHDIIDFGELPVFKSASTYPMIFIAQKKNGRAVKTTLTEVKSLGAPYPDIKQLVAEHGQVLPEGAIKGGEWSLMSNKRSQEIEQMRARGIPLGEYIGNKIYWGIKTGFNEAFVITRKQRSDFIEANSKNAEIIRPLAVGDDVRRWHVRDKDRYLIVTRIGVDMKRYPEIFEHLSQWEDNLRRRSDQGNHWWELRSCDYYDAFEKPKIIYPDMAQSSRFTLDTHGYYFGNTTYFIASDDLYLLGILNSKPFWGLCQQKFASFKGATLRFYKQDVLTLPIPTPTAEQREEMERLVTGCLERRGIDCLVEEREIDLLADVLYGFKVSSKP